MDDEHFVSVPYEGEFLADLSLHAMALIKVGIVGKENSLEGASQTIVLV